MYEPPIMDPTDRKGPFDRLTKKAALIVTLFAVLLYFALEYLGDSAKARAASICAAMIITATWMRWDLRSRVWFWVTILMLVLLHLPLIMLLPWTDKNYPGVVLLPGSLVDLAVIYGVIKLVERVMTGGRGAHIETKM
jgi:hypothetical protein